MKTMILSIMLAISATATASTEGVNFCKVDNTKEIIAGELATISSVSEYWKAIAAYDALLLHLKTDFEDGFCEDGEEKTALEATITVVELAKATRDADTWFFVKHPVSSMWFAAAAVGTSLWVVKALNKVAPVRTEFMYLRNVLRVNYAR